MLWGFVGFCRVLLLQFAGGRLAGFASWLGWAVLLLLLFSGLWARGLVGSGLLWALGWALFCRVLLLLCFLGSGLWAQGLWFALGFNKGLLVFARSGF